MNKQKIRRNLFQQYLSELDTYRIVPRPEPQSVQKKWFDEYWNDKGCKWHDIIVNDQLVGFLITSDWLPNCHPDADYAICEAYVLPDYRHQGLMSDYVKQFVCENRGVYCLLVIHGNVYGKQFWMKLFRNLSAKDVMLSDSAVISNGEHLCLLAFQV